MQSIFVIKGNYCNYLVTPKFTSNLKVTGNFQTSLLPISYGMGDVMESAKKKHENENDKFLNAYLSFVSSFPLEMILQV